MRPVKASDMCVGLRVAANFCGSDIPVEERTKADGTSLPFMRGHRGIVKDCSMLDHVLVDWVGLEDAPISFGVGFGVNDYEEYPGLLQVDGSAGKETNDVADAQ